MSKRAVLALASPAHEALLNKALVSQGVAVATVPVSAHLETEVMRAARSDREPPLLVVDLAVLAQLGAAMPGFCSWKAAQCPGARLVLTSDDLAAVGPAERAWARHHGALDLVCGCSARHWRETLLPVLRSLLDALEMPGLDEQELATVLQSLPKPYREAGAIARAWGKFTPLAERGLAPEQLVAEMRGPGGPEVADQIYRVRTYEECFVGTEAVDWIVRRTGLGRRQAAEIGQALLDLGHFYHVVREQSFRDGRFFYRFSATTPRLAATDLDRLLARFRSPEGVPIRDRMYHGITFRACFVGSQAVAWLRRERGYTHNEAMTLGQRWADLFIVHHVADEHPFKDGRFFYRFYEDERKRAR